MLRYALSFKKLKVFGDDNKRKKNMAIEAVLVNQFYNEKKTIWQENKTTVLINRVANKTNSRGRLDIGCGLRVSGRIWLFAPEKNNKTLNL